jgi:hypothetical protein
MSLNIEKLENVNYQDKRIIARCPACAEYGNDNKGDHLSIDKEGRFCCAVYTGDEGAEHRKRIFALVGEGKEENGIDRLDFQLQIKKRMSTKEIYEEALEKKYVFAPASIELKNLSSYSVIHSCFLYFIKGRKYTVEELAEWHVRACLFGEYGSRLIFPIYYKGKLVNYVGRSILNIKKKYKNCSNEEAIITSSNLLYGYDFIKVGQDELVICEGVFDTIRVGKGLAVSILGKKISPSQIELVASLNIKKRITILLDGDALLEAKNLANELRPLVNCEVCVIYLESGKDPDNYTRERLLEILR